MVDIAPASPAVGAAPPPAPTNAVEAKARRDQLMGDLKSVKSYLDGDAAVRSEMHALNRLIAQSDTTSRLDAVMLSGATAGNGIETTTVDDPLSTSELAGAVAGLRKWHPDEVIREIISGGTVTAEKRREAENAREKVMRDREFIAGYRAGHKEKIQHMRNINAVMAARVEG